jgi:hypothetical protein
VNHHHYLCLLSCYYPYYHVTIITIMLLSLLSCYYHYYHVTFITSMWIIITICVQYSILKASRPNTILRHPLYHVVCELSVNFQWTFSELSVNFQWTFSELSVKFQWRYPLYHVVWELHILRKFSYFTSFGCEILVIAFQSSFRKVSHYFFERWLKRDYEYLTSKRRDIRPLSQYV